MTDPDLKLYQAKFEVQEHFYPDTNKRYDDTALVFGTDREDAERRLRAAVERDDSYSHSLTIWHVELTEAIGQ